MGKWKYLLWCDLETTGTDSKLDPILEVAWIITRRESPFSELSHGSLVVNPDLNVGPPFDGFMTEGWDSRLGDFVRNMHTENGLLDDIAAGRGVSIDDAQEAIISQLSVHGREKDFLLAGSGVSHFDHRMIDAQMPRVAKWLQYPNHDVGNIRRALEMVDGGEEFAAQAYGANIAATGGTQHRALDDIRDHLNEWRVYAAFLKHALATPEDPF